jgi:hypothetical protein
MGTYINRGPDKRVDGWLGKIAGNIQYHLSFRARFEPAHVMLCFPFYISIAFPLLWTRDPERYFTIRAGWRYDKYWGDHADANGPADAPGQKHGGYIADVIIKPNMDNVCPY